MAWFNYIIAIENKLLVMEKNNLIFLECFLDFVFKKIIITVLKIDCMNLDRKSGTTWIAQFIIPFEFHFIILNHGGCYSSQLLVNLNH